MRLRQLFESPRTAVMAFGRMNPPTIGHAKLVDVVKSQGGDPYIFLSQTQKPKTDPLSFQDKLRYAKFFFPEVTIGNPEVKTIIQALQKINSLGYENLIYVAGSDRIQSFEELINKYNGKDYNFKSINVISAGQRDADAEGAEGMSASKLKKLAAEGKLEDWTDETGKKQPGFRSGVPKPEVADEMFAAVRKGMGIQEPVAAESFSPAQWLRNAFNSDPQFKAWYRMYKADPVKAEKTFRSKHAEYLAQLGEDASPEEEDDFHTALDKLVHKTFGHSSDEKKKKKQEDAPPGREKQVKALKKKFDDPGAPYAIAWAQHNKHGKPRRKSRG